MKLSEGFLLIELMIALTIGLFLFGICAYWQNSILMSYHDTTKRIEAMQEAHNLLDALQHDSSQLSQLQYDKNNIHITWQLQSAHIDLSKQMPFIKMPQSFKFVNVDVSWCDSRGKHTTTLSTGISC